ncbi:MAG: hypothetical protein RL468_450 [Pseudomonadota bacterium]|jgi:competence protein ComEA
MRQLLTSLIAISCCTLALAGTDINSASEAELDGLKGIGPALSSRILQAREAGPFQDWADLMRRVKGIRPKSAQQLSVNGLTVNGAAYTPPTPARPASRSP